MKSPLGVLALAILCIPTLNGKSAASPAALKTFFEREGFGGAALQRRFGNHLFVHTVMNGSKTALMIDSGCPQTLINRNSARRIGLRVQENKGYIVGVSGNAQRAGVSKVTTLAMGNCTFTNVPVEVADEEQINFIARPHLDGLFGAHEMAKFGMVIDCTRQMIYVNPKGPSAATSQKLAQFLTSRGFNRIPMRFNPEHHLEIDAAINGHPTRLIVDTGSAVTLVSESIATASGGSMSPKMSSHGEGIGYLKQLTLGNLVVNNAEVGVAHLAKFVGAGLLGEEYLSWNFAVIDFAGMNLYLRPPESASRKNR